MGEASVALFRAAEYRARLVLLAHRPGRIQADHVIAEYFSEQKRKWVMIDPMIDYQGENSVLSVLSDTKLSDALNRRHGLPHYRKRTTAIIDRRGPHRKIFYFTLSEEGRQITLAVLDKR